MTTVVVDLASTREDVEAVRELFLEYARSLGFDLCFQSFDEEMSSFPGKYAPPRGCLLLARVAGVPAGAVGLRPLPDGCCEMKRLYVRPEHRGHGLGRRLSERIVAEGRARGYSAMRLDTLASMAPARSVYRSLGFVEIPPYTYNPLPQAVYLELDLRATEGG